MLITGETGTGKEVFARLIHEHSAHKRGPFVPFNCSALPRELVESQLFGHRRGAFTGALDSSPGVIRAAERGTLFLDEIGDLDLRCSRSSCASSRAAKSTRSASRARVHVAVRIVAATNCDLETLIEQGKFRQDLFYRIGVARIALPPLRERKDEIPALAALFLQRFSRECHRQGLRLGDDAIAALLLYDWPGNIRQLSNEIRRMVALASDGDVLGPADLAPDIARAWNTRPITTPALTTPGRRDPSGSTAGAGPRGSRATVHRTRDGGVRRPRQRRRAVARALEEGPLPEAPAPRTGRPTRGLDATGREDG